MLLYVCRRLRWPCGLLLTCAFALASLRVRSCATSGAYFCVLTLRVCVQWQDDANPGVCSGQIDTTTPGCTSGPAPVCMDLPLCAPKGITSSLD